MRLFPNRAFVSLLASSSGSISGKQLSSNISNSISNMSNKMIVEYLRYTVPEEQHDSFVDAYKTAAVPLMKSPYAKSFEMCECAEDPTKFLLRIEWTSADDHMQGFRKSDEFKEFFTHIKPYLKQIDEMRHYNRLVSLKDES